MKFNWLDNLPFSFIGFNGILTFIDITFLIFFHFFVGYLGEKGRRIRELTSVVQKRFKFPENSVELYAEKVNNRGLCAIAQAESLRYKLLGGLAVRRYFFVFLSITTYRIFIIVLLICLGNGNMIYD